jgi:hypothetical protein
LTEQEKKVKASESLLNFITTKPDAPKELFKDKK